MPFPCVVILEDDVTRGTEEGVGHFTECQGNNLLLTMARQKQRRVYEEDEDFKVQSYLLKQCEQQNASVNERPRRQLHKQRGHMLSKNKAACTETVEGVQNENDILEALVDTEENTTVDRVEQDGQLDEYVAHVQSPLHKSFQSQSVYSPFSLHRRPQPWKCATHRTSRVE